jgi:hypothetical protein
VARSPEERVTELDVVVENARVAAMCGAEPGMAIAVAIASSGARSADDVFRLLDEKRAALTAAIAAPGGLKAMPPLEEELRYTPELATMHLDVGPGEQGDHDIRGRRLFAELLGKKDFFQVAALAIAGVELSDDDAELLGHCGVLTQLMDVRIWPLTVVRRVAARGHGLAASVVAGMATLINPRMAVLPVAGFMRALDRIDEDMRGGLSLEASLDGFFRRKEKIPGVGRPVVGKDERVAPKLALFERYGRRDGPSVRLAVALDALVAQTKGLGVNSAGYQAALLRDLGFAPNAAAAFCLLYFAVPVLAQAVYADDRRLLRR